MHFHRKICTKIELTQLPHLICQIFSDDYCRHEMKNKKWIRRIYTRFYQLCCITEAGSASQHGTEQRDHSWLIFNWTVN